jgi:hypothetical protein
MAMASSGFWIGALTVLFWSMWDFPKPYRTNELRFATTREGYILALSLYGIGALIVYLSLVLALRKASASSGFDPVWVANWAPLVAALFCTVLLPGALRRPLKAFRRAAQRVAQYPGARDNLSVSLCAARFMPHEDALPELKEELSRYGIAAETLEADLSRSALHALVQIQSLGIRLEQLRGEFPAFFERRADALAVIEREQSKVYRRSARAILFGHKIGRLPAAPVPRQSQEGLAISDFVAEEAEVLLDRYRKLIAEMALSCVANPADRRKLLDGFGYEPRSLPPSVPYWSLAACLVVASCFMILPYVVLNLKATQTYLAAQPWATRMPKDPVDAAMAAMLYGFMYLVAIALAVYPKAVSNFARPALTELPLRSYALFGACSYVAGLATGTLFQFALEPPGPPPGFSRTLELLLSPVFFAVLTIAVSYLIDLRLRETSYDFDRGRVRDGAMLASIMVATYGLWHLTMFGWQAPRTAVFFALMAGGLAFFIGFLIPGTAAAHLAADEAAAARDDSDGAEETGEGFQVAGGAALARA